MLFAETVTLIGVPVLSDLMSVTSKLGMMIGF